MASPQLPTLLQRAPFTYADAKARGLTQYALRQLLSSEKVERVGRGLYVAVDYDSTSPESQYQMAMRRCGKPSCICLLSALEHYQVTDTIPTQVWVMVPHTKRVSDPRLKLIRARDPQWAIGTHKARGYSITTLERTLVDCLIYRRIVGVTVALEAIKTALRQKKVTLSKIVDMAKRMGVLHRIQAVVEVLAV